MKRCIGRYLNGHRHTVHVRGDICRGPGAVQRAQVPTQNPTRSTLTAWSRHGAPATPATGAPHTHSWPVVASGSTHERAAPLCTTRRHLQGHTGRQLNPATRKRLCCSLLRALGRTRSLLPTAPTASQPTGKVQRISLEPPHQSTAHSAWQMAGPGATATARAACQRGQLAHARGECRTTRDA